MGQTLEEVKYNAAGWHNRLNRIRQPDWKEQRGRNVLASGAKDSRNKTKSAHYRLEGKSGRKAGSQV